MARLFLIIKHPYRWAMGACFICGELMLFDGPQQFIGNSEGFCYYHGTAGSVMDK